MKTISMQTLKGMFTKVAVLGALAGAVMLAAPKAEAQSGFSVRFGAGRPVYGQAYGEGYGPAYGDRFYAERRREEILRHEEAERREEYFRHERWERERAFGHGYDDRGFDHRDGDRGFDRRKGDRGFDRR